MDPWVVEVLRVGHHILFLCQPLLSKDPNPFVSYSSDSIKGRVLQEKIQALVKKGAGCCQEGGS